MLILDTNKIMKNRIKVIVKENTWMSRSSILDFGWGNGYITIPKGHPLFGINYDQIHDIIPMLEVNGGLTFAESASTLVGTWKELPDECSKDWIIGFDTCHAWDTLERWSKEDVIEEAEKLKQRILDFYKHND